MLTVKTDIGTITIPKSIIGNILTDVINSFEGKVMFSDSKGRVPKMAHKLGNKENFNYMEIEDNEDGIDLRIFVILRFGTSIKSTTAAIIDEVRRTVEEASGIKIGNISVVVTGMRSKNHIVLRHIEVTG